MYVFTILTHFNQCINYTCVIHFCTNSTHRQLDKVSGRSVQNANEIRADIRTRALVSRGSMDIYADICIVYSRNSMPFSTVCRWVKTFRASVRSVTSAPKSCYLNLQVVQRLLKNSFFSKIRHKIYFSVDCGHG